MHRVLLIDDDESLRARVCALLRAEGFDVTVAPDARAGIRAAVDDDFDLILLDLVLADDSGEHVMHAVLRSRPDARIVVVSGVGDVGRQAGALDMGAVDFVQKPFGDVELRARIRARIRADEVGAAALRRAVSRADGVVHSLPATPVGAPDVVPATTAGAVALRDAARRPAGSRAEGGASSAATDRAVRAVAADETTSPDAREQTSYRMVDADLATGEADFRVDVIRRSVIVHGKRVELSQREFLLMCYLLRRKGHVCTREEILAAVWGINFHARTNVVDVYIRRLRAKLNIDTIDTVRKVGYRLSAA